MIALLSFFLILLVSPLKSKSSRARRGGQNRHQRRTASPQSNYAWRAAAPPSRQALQGWRGGADRWPPELPRRYLEKLVGRPVYTPLLNRSGLNCRVELGATIR